MERQGPFVELKRKLYVRRDGGTMQTELLRRCPKTYKPVERGVADRTERH